MPIPTPSQNEERNHFMSRCMSFMTKENEGKPDGKKRARKELVAICMTQWTEKSKANKESISETETEDEGLIEENQHGNNNSL